MMPLDGDDTLFHLPLVATEEEYQAVLAECMLPGTEADGKAVLDERSRVAHAIGRCANLGTVLPACLGVL